mgnify:CR=1 FL=1
MKMTFRWYGEKDSQPVEHRHKVITYALYSRFAQITDSLGIVGYQSVSRRLSELYVFVNGNLVYFLNGIMPACDETGINMAIHPDDPPWDMFGLPSLVSVIL